MAKWLVLAYLRHCSHHSDTFKSQYPCKFSVGGGWMTIFHKEGNHDELSDSVYAQEYIIHGYKTQYITYYLAITNREVYLI
jgi:hypothetical protein